MWCWAYLFEKTDGFSFDELVRDIGRFGFRLANPESGRVTRLTVDGFGVEPTKPGSEVQIVSSQHELASLISSGYEVPFQWWTHLGTDVFCNIRRISAEILAQLYDLQIVDSDEKLRLYRALFARFQKGVERGSSLGLIFDPKGLNEDFDWKEYFLKPKRGPWHLPDVVILDPKLAKRLRTKTKLHLIEHLGQFTMIARRDSAFAAVTTSLIANPNLELQ